MIEIKINSGAEPGFIYLIPYFIRCIHCNHEMPVGIFSLNTTITDNGGCGKQSNIVDYAKYFGMIRM